MLRGTEAAVITLTAPIILETTRVPVLVDTWAMDSTAQVTIVHCTTDSVRILLLLIVHDQICDPMTAISYIQS